MSSTRAGIIAYVLVLLSFVHQSLGGVIPGFLDELYVGGSGNTLNEPMAFAFLPSGDMLIVERPGRIVRVSEDANGVPLTECYMTITALPESLGFAGGLQNIVLDPDFATNNYFYIYYTHALPAETGHQRISRFTYNSGPACDPCDAAQCSVLASETLIWQAEEPVLQHNHMGGGLGIGADGFLYLALGEQFEEPDAQNPCNTRGSLIRVDPSVVFDPANPVSPADNPIWDMDTLGLTCDSTLSAQDPEFCFGCFEDEKVRNFVYAIGLRNPFRASWDLQSNRFFIGEVGDNGPPPKYEDIHLVRTGQAGLNFRWPDCAGPECSDPCDCTTTHSTNQGTCTPLPDVEGCYADGAEPVFSYSHSDYGGSGSVTGGFVYRTESPAPMFQFPASYNGAYFFADFTSPFIRYLEFEPGDDGAVLDGVSQPFADGDDNGFPLFLAQGPDGALYYLSRDVGFPASVSTGVLRRIIPDSEPVLTSTFVDPRSSPSPPLVVELTATAIDTDSDPIYYRWLITQPDGNTVIEEDPLDPTNAMIQVSLQDSGLHSIRVEVRDELDPLAANRTLSDPILVEVGRRPIPRIFTPESCDSFQAGNTIELSGGAFDPNDPDGVGSLTYEWNVRTIPDGNGMGSVSLPTQTETNSSGTSDVSFSIDDFGGLDFEIHKALRASAH